METNNPVVRCLDVGDHRLPRSRGVTLQNRSEDGRVTNG